MREVKDCCQAGSCRDRPGTGQRCPSVYSKPYIYIANIRYGGLFTIESPVDGSHSLVGLLLGNEHRDLDLTGGDHLDVDVGLTQCLEHLGSYTGMGFHTSAHNGYLCHIGIADHTLEAQGILAPPPADGLPHRRPWQQRWNLMSWVPSRPPTGECVHR